MSIDVELSEDGRYVLVTQQGLVSMAKINATRIKSRPFYKYCDRTLIDFRQADISPLNFMEIDDLGASFKKALPCCIKAAFVRTPGPEDRIYAHLANTYSISGVDTELFETLAAAREWLLEV
ncbi:MAG: hypothetical protein ACI9W6_001171 [Motiliproteus sp.]|jgi:hypothetical protein